MGPKKSKIELENLLVHKKWHPEVVSEEAGIAQLTADYHRSDSWATKRTRSTTPPSDKPPNLGGTPITPHSNPGGTPICKSHGFH
ncbi:hypothetical protein M8J77_022141 [Diaphorina citri]|nr:hypothetical protein M8J77_022141 [Diaphorina citri]